MPKYNVGDEVRIKVLTPSEHRHPYITYVPEMLKLQGKTGKVVEHSERGYNIVTVGRYTWHYADDWLEPLAEYNAF